MKKLFIVLALLFSMAIPVHAQFSRITSVTLNNNNNTQAAFYASPFTIKAGAACTWSITGTVATFNCAGGGGTPGGADGTIQYNNSSAFGGVTGLINGPADCDGSGDSCTLKISVSGFKYSLITTDTDGPAGNYSGVAGFDDTGTMNTFLDAWDGTNYATFLLNSLTGAAIAPAVKSAIYRSNSSDPADGGIFRFGNNEQICWEANPAGTDGCAYMNTQNNFQVSNVNAIVAPGISLNGNPVAGFIVYAAGTTAAAVSPCNNATAICEQAPSAGVTSYLVTKPPVAAQGTRIGRNTAAVITEGFSGDADHAPTPITIGSGTSIGPTSFCSTTNCPVGTYRVNAYLDITTACTVSGTYLVNLIYTDDVGSKTIPINLSGTGTVPATGVVTTTSTANFGQAAQILRSTGGASINYSTTALACGGGGPMVGKLYLSVEPVQ